MSYQDMPEGREMDRMVAERVMGWKPEIDKHGEWRVVDGAGERRTKRDVLAVSFDPRTGERHNNPWSAAADVPWFSSDIASAWEVLEKLQRDDSGIQWRCEPRGFWRAWIGEAQAEADTAPLAICRAALMAISA